MSWFASKIKSTFELKCFLIDGVFMGLIKSLESLQEIFN